MNSASSIQYFSSNLYPNKIIKFIPREIDSVEVNTITSYEQQEFREITTVLTSSNPSPPFFSFHFTETTAENSKGAEDVMNLNVRRKKHMILQNTETNHWNIAKGRETSMF